MFPPWSGCFASLPPCFRRREGWIDKGYSSIQSPFASPQLCCLCLGKSWVKGESISPLPQSDGHLILSVETCVVGVLGKASHLFPPDAGASRTSIHREQQKAAGDSGETRPDLAKQDVAWAILPPGVWKYRGMWKQNTRDAKWYLPDLPVERTYTGDTFVLFANERKTIFPQPHIEKALKSSKVKLVTLQYKMIYFTCSKIYKKWILKQT